MLFGCERPKNECFTLPTVGKEHALGAFSPGFDGFFLKKVVFSCFVFPSFWALDFIILLRFHSNRYDRGCYGGQYGVPASAAAASTALRFHIARCLVKLALLVLCRLEFVFALPVLICICRGRCLRAPWRAGMPFDSVHVQLVNTIPTIRVVFFFMTRPSAYRSSCLLLRRAQVTSRVRRAAFRISVLACGTGSLVPGSIGATMYGCVADASAYVLEERLTQREETPAISPGQRCA